MRVTLRLFANLREYLPPGEREETVVDLPDGAPVQELLDRFRLPPPLTQLVLVNGVNVGRDHSRVLVDGDVVSIFPPVAGGSR